MKHKQGVDHQGNTGAVLKREKRAIIAGSHHSLPHLQLLHENLTFMNRAGFGEAGGGKRSSS